MGPYRLRTRPFGGPDLDPNFSMYPLNFVVINNGHDNDGHGDDTYANNPYVIPVSISFSIFFSS